MPGGSDFGQSRGDDAGGRRRADAARRLAAACGGAATVRNPYGEAAPGVPALPPEHESFVRRCLPYYETETHILLHANYDPELPLGEQDLATIRWRSLRESIPTAHRSGKTVILGHTPTKSGEVLDLGYLKCIDTYCYGGGWLTALELTTGELWQADRDGRLRSIESETKNAEKRICN